MAAWSKVSLGERLIHLALFLALVSILDWFVRGRAATRGKDSVLLLASGALGALFGALFDSLTVRWSPEYFVIGKGLASGPGLAARARALGVEAGFGAGLVAGCVLVGLHRHVRAGRALSNLSVLGLLWRPAATALLGAIGLGAVACWILVRRLAEAGAPSVRLEGLELEESLAFVHVFALHAGAYVGAVVGLVWAALELRRRLRRTGER